MNPTCSAIGHPPEFFMKHLPSYDQFVNESDKVGAELKRLGFVPAQPSFQEQGIPLQGAWKIDIDGLKLMYNPTAIEDEDSAVQPGFMLFGTEKGGPTQYEAEGADAVRKVMAAIRSRKIFGMIEGKGGPELTKELAKIGFSCSSERPPFRLSPQTMSTFSHFAAKAANMNDVALVASIKDCIEAAKACAGHDAKREGEYMDEASCYRAELVKRTASNPLA